MNGIKMNGIKHTSDANVQGFIWALEDTEDPHNTDMQPEDIRGGGY